MRRFLLALPCLLISSCSTYYVFHEEKDSSGTTYRTVIRESVAPGGSKISNGRANIEVDANGTWRIALGADIDSDSTQTAKLLEKALESAVLKILAGGAWH